MLLAVACKDRKLRVLDPRQPSKVYITSAFDSPRSFQVEWTNDHQIICVGHTSGSMRKLQLFTLDKDVLSTGGSLSLDVSPALLFPHFDPDTALLWLWCKGSSTITSFDIHVENTKQPFAAVPPFIGGNLQNGVVFLPKTTVDVRGVEVMKALRLTAREVQEISWKVPRRHVERFQDDVFPPTQGPPSASVEAWQKGEEVAVVHVDLQPEGMETREYLCLLVGFRDPATDRPRRFLDQFRRCPKLKVPCSRRSPRCALFFFCQTGTDTD